MKQLLILSGKGGTGKTTAATAFVHFSHTHACADCDVDAPNLHIANSIQGTPITQEFQGMPRAFINPDD